MENYIGAHIESSKTNWKSFKKIYGIHKTSNIKKWLWGVLVLLCITLLLPWTQNIRAKGTVTTLRQEERPQELNSVIAGRVIQWHIKEGDYVKKGDTILQLGEIKSDYFDTSLLSRTKEQINAKNVSLSGYNSKAGTAETQGAALAKARELKLQSISNKIQQQLLKIASDSMDIIAINNEMAVYKRQQSAGLLMLDSGAISLSELEKRKVNYQNSLSKKIIAENKYLQNKQELNNLYIEQNSTIQDYIDKIAKVEGDKFGSLSAAATIKAEVSKLENAYTNYDIRNRLYYIIAPQNGQIIKAKKAGTGEIVKEGEMVAEIVPTDKQLAVELFVEPMDLPLINIGQKVCFVFDGFPAIVFSGWPANSFGTFRGKVAAIETAVGENGKFRILVTEDQSEKPWPAQLRMGGGAYGIALLKNVSIYYELWRNINGFPPEYYSVKEDKKIK